MGLRVEVVVIITAVRGRLQGALYDRMSSNGIDRVLNLVLSKINRV